MSKAEARRAVGSSHGLCAERVQGDVLPGPMRTRRSGPRAPRFFAKLFQRSVVPMPSFSKECLGGFVGFQWVTLAPNQNCSSPNIFGSRAEMPPRPDRCQVDRRRETTLAYLVFLRKNIRRKSTRRRGCAFRRRRGASAPFRRWTLGALAKQKQNAKDDACHSRESGNPVVGTR
jgi:hypothetical protein